MEIEPLSQWREWIPQLARWHHAQWEVYNPGQTLAKRVALLELEAVDGDLPLAWVARDGDELLGSASLVESDLELRPEMKPWLASVFVAPEHRQRGIGGALVRFIAAQARERGFPAIYLYTPDQMRFYERLGWSEIEKVAYHGDQITLMRQVF